VELGVSSSPHSPLALWVSGQGELAESSWALTLEELYQITSPATPKVPLFNVSGT